jgi:hypothetical protein
MSGEAIRLEEYTGLIQSKLVAAWQAPDAVTPWLPTEFLLSQYITRILVTGRTSPLSVALTADSGWTQVWRSPGAKEWSCLMGILQHMPGPVLIVVGPDIGLTTKLVASLRGVCAAPTAATVVVLRSAGLPGGGWAGDPPDHVFFPILSAATAQNAGMMTAVQEWVTRAAPRGLDLRPLLPQLAAANYGLTVAGGVWHWYRPADSPPLATLTVAQIARQLQILGAVLEKMSV